ncbi:uncharacterized protein LOC121644387 [Melanotaenia boesemani]|nr:uncharacterized protein LOC121644387 [Melanotaenia boesemani]
MASENFRQWLEEGKALADELEAKKPSKKRKQKGTGGSNVSWRTRDHNGYIVPKFIRKNRSVKHRRTMEVPEVETSQMDEVPQEVTNLDNHLQTLRDLLSSVTVPASAEVEETTSMSVWTKRQLTTERKFKAAVPELLSCMLAAERVPQHCCQKCKTVKAVVRCLDCVPSGVQFLCAGCDSIVHKKNVFHDREVMIDHFYKHIPPTSLVKMDESGHCELVEQVCMLPILPPTQICSCGPD